MARSRPGKVDPITFSDWDVPYALHVVNEYYIAYLGDSQPQLPQSLPEGSLTWWTVIIDTWNIKCRRPARGRRHVPGHPLSPYMALNDA